MNKNAIGYIRVSSEEQTKNFSLVNQIEAIQREAHVRGYTLLHIFRDDGFSGTTTVRPGLQEALTYSKNKRHQVLAFIVYKLDRISRETSDYLNIRKKLAENGTLIVSCTEHTDDTPASEYVETILAANAKYENEIKRQRIIAGIKQRLKHGYPSSVAPFGYRNETVDGRHVVTVDPIRGPLVREAFYEMSRGCHTLESIAALLNKRLTLLGDKRRFYRQQVSRLFSNMTYLGYTVSQKHGIFKSDKIPPLVDETIFYMVRSHLMKTGEHPNLHQKIRPEFPLRGLLLCTQCNKPLTAGYSRSHTGKYYGYYFCNTHATPSLSASKIDDKMCNLLRELTPTPLLRRRFIDAVKEKYNATYMQFVKQEETVKQKIEKLQGEQVEITRRNAAGTVKDEVAKRAIDQIDAEILTLQTIKSESKLARVDIEILTKWMDSFLSDMSLFYQGEYAVGLKRLLVGSIFPKKLIVRNNDLEPIEIEPCFNLKHVQEQAPVTLSAGKRT